MLNHDNQELCWEVLSKYGIRNQRMMVIEECSELQKTICKMYRKDFPSVESDDNFLEELVDVIVMCQQMILADGISMDVVNKLANKKLNRALEG